MAAMDIGAKLDEINQLISKGRIDDTFRSFNELAQYVSSLPAVNSIHFNGQDYLAGTLSAYLAKSRRGMLARVYRTSIAQQMSETKRLINTIPPSPKLAVAAHLGMAAAYTNDAANQQLIDSLEKKEYEPTIKNAVEIMQAYCK